jgi:replicative DNA helicase
MLDGLHNGELILLAARASMGKTSLAGNTVEHLAIDKHGPVGFFSMEMGERQFIERMACSLAGVDVHRMRKRILNAQDFNKLAQAVHDVERSKL